MLDPIFTNLSDQYRDLRNRVNRERKLCRARFYESTVKQLKESKPATWWREVKNLSGMSSASGRPHPATLYQHIDCGQPTPPTLQDIANTINKAFLAPMNAFEPLAADSFPRPIMEECPLKLSELSVFEKMLSLNPSKATGPDGVPDWLLKENADLFAQPVADILSSSFQEAWLPSSWKDANIAPVPKGKPIRDVNKHLRPISLTPVLSKLAEDYVVEQYVKPAVLARVDANQFCTVPGSNTTIALISMLHSWLCDKDGNGATVRAILLDFRKAFDLIDHKILVRKLMTYSLPCSIITWITDFLTRVEDKELSLARTVILSGAPFHPESHRAQSSVPGSL